MLRDARVEHRVRVDRLPFTLGSAPACDLVLEGSGVAEVAATIELSERGHPELWYPGGKRWVRLKEGAHAEVGPYVVASFPEAEASDGRDLLGPVLDLVPALWAAGDARQALAALLATLRQVFRAEWGAVLRFPDEGHQPEVLCQEGERKGGGAPQVSRTVLEKLRDEAAAMLHTDVAAVPALVGARSLPVEVRSILAAALLNRGRRLGVVYLENPVSSRAFESHEVQLIERLCGFAATQLAHGATARRLAEKGERLDALHRLERSREHDPAALVGESPGLVEVREQAKRAGERQVTTLILGETGTGKELVARAVHDAGPRAERPFVAVNCAAIPEGLVESELFGAARGAFTGADRDRAGRFELADGGTLFLDEFGELPAGTQAKLLRVLETRTVTRLGDGRTQPVDVHVVAATNADPGAQVAEGRLREDLYYRVAVFVIQLPPLRQRGGDLKLLVDHFCEVFRRRYGRRLRGVSRAAMAVLEEHPWPGNVRELRNVIEQAFVREAGEWIQPESFFLMRPRTLPGGEDDELLPLADARAEWERDYLRRALGRSKTVTAAARSLGLSRQALYEKCAAYALEPSELTLPKR